MTSNKMLQSWWQKKIKKYRFLAKIELEQVKILKKSNFKTKAVKYAEMF